MTQQEQFLAAVKAGDATRVLQMLNADSSLAGVADGAVSSILTAVYRGHLEVARLLAARGTHIGFFEACALGDAARVKTLVESDPSLLHTHSADGFAPFGFATFFGHPDIDRLLLEYGADIHAQATNPSRVGAVHAAAAACDHDMMQLLLARGANPNARQQMEYTALHTAAGRGDVRMATLLIAHGAERDAKGSDGKTPADVAREHGQETFAEWLASYEP